MLAVFGRDFSRANLPAPRGLSFVHEWGMTMSTTYTTDRKRLEANIKSIGRRGANLDRDIWASAVGSIAHAQEHGDLSLFAMLLSAMPKGSRVQTLIAWAQQGAPLTVAYSKDKGTYKVSIDKKSDRFESDRSDWDIAFLSDVEWYAFKKEAEQKVFDLADLIAMVERIAEGKRPNSTEAAMDAATHAYNLLVELQTTKAKAEVEAA
jgi:hypothetical protein